MKKMKAAMVVSSLLILGLVLVPAGGAQATDTAQVLKYYSQYQQGGMSSYKLANEIAMEALKVPDDAGCLLCHSTQGFIEWAGAGFKKGYAPKLLEADTALGVDCAGCHNPDGSIRVVGTTPDLTSGFKVENAGTGAVCMVCHNSRRGLYNDQAMPRTNHRVSHETASTDVLVGQNFFFVPVGETIAHCTDVENTCVGCHAPKQDGMTSHSFTASFETCRECHTDMDGEKFKAGMIAAFGGLEKAYDDSMAKMVQVNLDAGTFEVLNTNEDESEDTEWTKFKKGAKLTAIEGIYFHGGQGWNLTIDGKKYLAVIKNMKVNGVKLLDTAEGQIIAKVGWNVWMYKHDRSNGAHNPPFIKKAIEASMAKVNETDFAKVTALPAEEKK